MAHRHTKLLPVQKLWIWDTSVSLSFSVELKDSWRGGGILGGGESDTDRTGAEKNCGIWEFDGGLIRGPKRVQRKERNLLILIMLSLDSLVKL